MPRLNRRGFLRSTAALGGSLLASRLGRTARAAAPPLIDAPVVDRVVVREITDNAHDIFLRPLERPGLSVQRPGSGGGAGQDARKRMGPRAAHRIGEGQRVAPLSARLRLYLGCLCQQSRPIKNRSGGGDALILSHGISTITAG